MTLSRIFTVVLQRARNQQSVWANDLLRGRLGRRNHAGCGFSLSICQPCVSFDTYS